jgi:hypothetical protein
MGCVQQEPFKTLERARDMQGAMPGKLHRVREPGEPRPKSPKVEPFLVCACLIRVKQ